MGVLSNWRVLLSMMKGDGKGEQGDDVKMKGGWSSGMGGEGFELFDAHCHIDRVLKGLKSRMQRSWVRSGRLWGWCRGGGKTNGGIVTRFACQVNGRMLGR